MKIVVNKIEPQQVELFDPNHNSMGFINEYEFHDIRVQIKNQQVAGYYCKWTDEHGIENIFNIDKDGRSWDWKDGFFDKITNYLMDLI